MKKKRDNWKNIVVKIITLHMIMKLITNYGIAKNTYKTIPTFKNKNSYSLISTRN